MIHVNKNGIDGVVIDLKKIIPMMKDYNVISMTMECWMAHLAHWKGMPSAKRIEKLGKFRALVKQCYKSMKTSKCITLRKMYYLNLVRFSISTGLVAYTLMHIHNRKGYPIRKIVTEAGTQELGTYLHKVKKRWATVHKAAVHLCTNEPELVTLKPCTCHPTAFAKYVKPHLSLHCA